MKRWGFLCLMVLLSCGVAGTLYLRSHYGLSAASFGAAWNIDSDSPKLWHGQVDPNENSQDGISVRSLKTEHTAGTTETVEAEKEREHKSHQRYKKHVVSHESNLEDHEVEGHAESAEHKDLKEFKAHENHLRNVKHKDSKKLEEFEGYTEVKQSRDAQEPRNSKPTVQQAQAKESYYLPEVVKGFYYRNPPNGWNAATSVILCLGAAVLIVAMILSTVDRRGAGGRNRAVPEIYVGEETGEEFVIPYVSIAYM